MVMCLEALQVTKPYRRILKYPQLSWGIFIIDFLKTRVYNRWWKINYTIKNDVIFSYLFSWEDIVKDFLGMFK